MTYTRPFVTNRFIALAGDSRGSEVALAVIVLDAFTEKPPQAELNVRLKEEPRLAAIKNQSGFFCFKTLAAGPHTLVFESDRTNADWYYLESDGPVWTDTFERVINLPMPDPKNPLERATLVPKTAYPFPANATLVRGFVTQGTDEGVGEVIVSTTYQHVPKGPPNAPPAPPVPKVVRALTDGGGEFVLFFKRLPGQTQPITLTAEKAGKQKQDTVTITEGKILKGVQLDLPL